MKAKYKSVKYKNNLTKIPFFDLGDIKKGFCVVVAQLHGDEYSSRLICREILKTKKLLNKGLRVLTCANPQSAETDIKEELTSGLNLNRLFKTEIDGPRNMAHELAEGIIDLCRGADFVVDLHDMPGSELPVSAILTLTNNQKINIANYELISKFLPDITWFEDFRIEPYQRRYSGTINSYLNLLDIPSFTIETNPINNILEKDIKRVANGLVRLLGEKREKSGKTKIFERIEIRSDINALFLPSPINLLSEIKKNKVIGQLLMPNLSKKEILAPQTGTLLRKAQQKLVRKGEKIFDLGKEVLWKDLK